MKTSADVLITIGLMLGYYSGLVIAIGIAARFGPHPSMSPLLVQLNHLLAVMTVSGLAAALLLYRFDHKALLLGLVVAAPAALDTASAIANSHFVQTVAIGSGISAVKDLVLIFMGPTSMAALIWQFRTSSSTG